MSKRIAVLMGGISAEREVSLVSGKACVEALREAGYQAIGIELRRSKSTAPMFRPRSPERSIRRCRRTSETGSHRSTASRDRLPELR